MFKYVRLVLSVFFISSIGFGCAPSLSTQTAIAQTRIAPSISTFSPVSTSIAALVQNPTPALPVSNAIYFGTVEGNNAIFVTSDLTQAYYKKYFSSYEYLGELYFYNTEGFDFNFNDIKNPRLLFSIAGNEDQIHVMFAGGKAYISGIMQEADFTDVSFIYAINPDTGDFQKVWTGMPGYVDDGSDKYLVIKLLPCYRCSPPPLRKTMIINAVTGAEKELGEVGDVIISIEKSTVSYRYLTPLQVPCDPGEGCDHGFYTDYETAGEFFIEPLP